MRIFSVFAVLIAQIFLFAKTPNSAVRESRLLTEDVDYDARVHRFPVTGVWQKRLRKRTWHMVLTKQRRCDFVAEKEKVCTDYRRRPPHWSAWNCGDLLSPKLLRCIQTETYCSYCRALRTISTSAVRVFIGVSISWGKLMRTAFIPSCVFNRRVKPSRSTEVMVASVASSPA